MSNVNEVVEQQDDVAEVKEIDYKSLYEETQKKLDVVAAHKDKLYQETKAAKAEREAAKQEAERITQEKSLKDGEFEKLWQKASQEKESLAKEIQNIKSANRNEKIQNSSLLIANRLADGDNVELLSEFVQKSLVSLADENGALSAEVLDAVQREFEQNAKFKSLLKRNGSVGSGAPGNARGAANASVKPTITRAQLEETPMHKRKELLKKSILVD